MDVILYKKPISISVNTLNALTDNFKCYTLAQKYSGEIEIQYEEVQTAIDLMSGGIRQISRARQELKSQISQLKKEYSEAASKEEKKSLLTIIEDIEKETNFNDVVGKADEMQYMLESRLTEAKSTKNRLARKLSIEKGTETSGCDSKLDVDTNKLTSDNSCNEEFDISPSDWLTEDNSTDSLEKNNPAQTVCRSIRTPALTLPKFYGVEEDFPEFWAIYETLIHHNQSLSTVEKNDDVKR